MRLDKIKRSHNNKMINNVIKKGNCQILNDNDLKEMNDIFSNKTNLYNECRYGKELPNTNKRKMIKAIAERVNNNRKDIEEKIKDKRQNKNKITLGDGTVISIERYQRY